MPASEEEAKAFKIAGILPSHALELVDLDLIYGRESLDWLKPCRAEEFISWQHVYMMELQWWEKAYVYLPYQVTFLINSTK